MNNLNAENIARGKYFIPKLVDRPITSKREDHTRQDRQTDEGIDRDAKGARRREREREGGRCTTVQWYY